MATKKVIKEIVPVPPVENVGKAGVEAVSPVDKKSLEPVENVSKAGVEAVPPVDKTGVEPVRNVREAGVGIEILPEIVTIEDAIDALKIAKKQVVSVLDTDIEHLFEPIEIALAYKAKQSDDSNINQIAENQVGEKEAGILSLQEAANRKLEEFRRRG